MWVSLLYSIFPRSSAERNLLRMRIAFFSCKLRNSNNAFFPDIFFSLAGRAYRL